MASNPTNFLFSAPHPSVTSKYSVVFETIEEEEEEEEEAVVVEHLSFNIIMSKLYFETMEEEEDVVVNWLELPEHLSFEIMAKLTSLDDRIRFGAVSVQWRSLLFSEYCPKLPPQPPLLIVPTPPSPPPLHEEEEEEAGIGEKKKKKTNATTTRSCSFYRITDNKVYNQLQLAMPFNRHFRGSGHGWLVTMDDDDVLGYPVRLINPFFFPKPPNCKEIQLPPLSNFLAAGEHFFSTTPLNLKKAILSADPISNPKDYIVMVIYGGLQKLAFYKPGGDKEAWTIVETEYENRRGPFDDIIYYKDKFYAIHHYGELVVCDLERRIAEEIVEPMPGIKPSERKYLVESSGDLLLVVRFIDYENYPSYSTIEFKVFKLLFLDDPTGKFLLNYLNGPLEPAMDGIEPEWVEVKDLHGCAIFVGCNASHSVSASNFQGCKPNCIYYTDDDIETFHLQPGYGSQDIGLFNLEVGSIEKHYPTEMGKQILPPPIWIQPPQPQNIIRKKLM